MRSIQKHWPHKESDRRDKRTAPDKGNPERSYFYFRFLEDCKNHEPQHLSSKKYKKYFNKKCLTKGTVYDIIRTGLGLYI